MTTPDRRPAKGQERPPAPGTESERKPQDRSLINRPTDPNRTGADVQVPPGISSEDLHDPGNTTPDAPPVDNRS